MVTEEYVTRMRRIVRGLLATLVLAVAAGADDPRANPRQARPGPASADSASASAPLPWYVIVSPKDLAELWRKIADPDFAIVKPEAFAVDAPRGNRGKSEPRSAVESVAVHGRIEGDVADLKLELAIAVKGELPVWTSIRLDDLRISAAREADRDLPVRMTPDRRWEVLVEGAGTHKIEVALRADVISSLARRSITLATPEAASTSLELDFPDEETDVLVAGNEDYGLSPVPGGKGRRLSARLSPRSRIEASWSTKRDRELGLAPVLTAEGDVAIELDLDQATTQAAWAIRSVRGVARELEFRLDDADEVIETRLLDDPAAEPTFERTREEHALKIRLPDPLRPGGVARVMIKTRRAISKGDGLKLRFQGFPLRHAKRQTGAVSVVHGAELWVSVAAASGLRRINPQKLPAELRARPDTHLALEFRDQPFRLELGIESSPPLYLARSTAFVELRPELAESETRIILEPVRGRIEDLELEVAPGLEITSIGPAEAIELANPPANNRDARSGVRPLRIRLSAAAREQKNVTLVVRSRQSIPGSGPVLLGLVTTAAARGAARLAIHPARSLLVEVEGDPAATPRLSEPEFGDDARPRDWMKPLAVEEGLGAPVLLGLSAGASTVSLKLTRRPRELIQDARLNVRATRQGLDLLQQTRLRIRHGIVRAIEITVPAEIGDRWEILEQEVERKEDLGKTSDGGARWRLTFAQPATESLRLAFRAKLPFEPPLDASPRSAHAPRIATIDGASGPTHVMLELDPDLHLDSADSAWTRVDPAPEQEGSGAPIEFAEATTAAVSHPFNFSIRAEIPAPLPDVVVSRQLIRTSIWADSTSHRAWLQLESRLPEITLELPEDARLLEARINGRPAEAVEQGDAISQFRLRLASNQRAVPVLVELGYDSAAPRSSWTAPRLARGSVVLQSIWEVRIPANRELVGTPPGWTDLNHWVFERVAWRRQPLRSAAALLDWVVGSSSRVVVDDASADDGDDTRRLVFSRALEPVPFSPRIWSRAALVALCSGLVLAAGFAAIFARIRFHMLALAALGFAAASAALFAPSEVVLLLQSSFLGFVLSLLGLLIERRLARARAIVPSEPSGRTIRPTADSSLDRASAVGSEGSTEIRVRTSTTIDYARAESRSGE